MKTIKELKEAIFRLQREVDSDAKLELQALDHLEKMLELHDDYNTRKLAHAAVDIFEVLYNIEEKERKLISELEKKEHRTEEKDKNAVLELELNISKFRLLLSDTRAGINAQLLDKLADAFRKKAMEQHNEIKVEEADV